MQPADEGPCAPKMCRQQRGAYSTMKTFQSKRLEGKSRFDRSAVAEVPLFGDGHHFTFHPEQPHHFQPHHHHQRLQQQHHQTSVPISSSQQHHPTSQQQQQQQPQHRFPSENRPSSRVPTSTSAPAASVAAAASPGIQQRRGSGGKAEPRFSPDCTYGISSGGVFQTCSE